MLCDWFGSLNKRSYISELVVKGWEARKHFAVYIYTNYEVIGILWYYIYSSKLQIEGIFSWYFVYLVKVTNQ